MTDRRRELKRQYLAAERGRERALLPITDAELDDLLVVLDESLGGRGCDHSFESTERWLREHGRGGEVLHGLRQLGAFCDCEVLANIDHDRF